MIICKIENCNRKHYGRGYCSKHWIRFYRYGSPYVVKIAPKGNGHISKFGYKSIHINGKIILEHRYIMEQSIMRKLKPFPIEIVHHENGNKSDNRIENLKLTTMSQHNSFHHTRSFIRNNKKQCSKCKKNLSLIHFSKSTGGHMGHRADCKTCQNKYNQKRLANK